MNGACSGNPEALDLRFTTVPVSVSLTSNGQPATWNCPAGAQFMSMVFDTADAGPQWSQILCGAPVAFEVRATAGMTVTPTFAGNNAYDPTPWISLPDFARFTSITVSGPTSRTFDVVSRRVRGTVRSDGNAPFCSSTTDRFGEIAFKSTTPGSTQTFSGVITCAAGGSTAAYDIWLPVGSYDVAVRGQFFAELPLRVATGATVTSTTSTLDFSATTFMGTLQFSLNGSTPVDGCGSVSPIENLAYTVSLPGFESLASYATATCSTPNRYSRTFRMGGGTYDVRVTSAFDGSLPITNRAAVFSLFGPSTSTVLLAGFRVTGSVTVDGVPMGGCETAGASGATVELLDTTSPRTRYRLPVQCNGATTFAGWVSGGSYRPTINAGGAPSQLPIRAGLSWGSQTSVSVSSTLTLPLQLATTTVTATARTAGMAPMSRCAGPTSETLVRFGFAGDESTSGGEMTTTCASGTFTATARVILGRYKLRVTSYEASTLPWSAVLPDEVDITASTPPLIVDFARRVAGTIVVNGTPEVCTAGAEVGMVRFVPETGRGETYLQARCGTNGSVRFEGFLPRGRYTLSAYDVSRTVDFAGSTLPSWPTSAGLFDIQ